MKKWDVTVIREERYERTFKIEAESAERARDLAESVIEDGLLSFGTRNLRSANEFVAGVGDSNGGEQ